MKVGEDINTANASWSFGGDVPNNFEEHVKKSVPNYVEGHKLIKELSDFFIHKNSIFYEIGCSTGILTNIIADHNKHKQAKFIGIDIEKDMISYANEKYSNSNGVEFFCESVEEYSFQKSDMIVSYYTMQFISPSVRQLIINKIYESLNWGGAFVLFEKVRAKDARFQDIMTALYTEYKLDQGYNPSEIISKAKSLKGVLEPFSTQGNLDLLTRAGFVDVMTIKKHVCFEGFLAIK